MAAIERQDFSINLQFDFNISYVQIQDLALLGYTDICIFSVFLQCYVRDVSILSYFGKISTRFTDLSHQVRRGQAKFETTTK